MSWSLAMMYGFNLLEVFLISGNLTELCLYMGGEERWLTEQIKYQQDETR